jgi:hypothetical protein
MHDLAKVGVEGSSPFARSRFSAPAEWKFDEGPPRARAFVFLATIKGPLRDAATYATELPEEEAASDEWQAAIGALILVAKSRTGPTMMARNGVIRALHRHDERVFNPSHKEPHWGKRKLLRDR